MDLNQLIASALPNFGCTLVDCERVSGANLLRILIDKDGGVTVDDCALVSNHLIRLFEVEGVSYDRLEVSSPGLDRPLITHEDYERFKGELVSVQTNLPINGRKNFKGVLRGLNAEQEVVISIENDQQISIDIREIKRTKLVPKI
ncbi:MAG: ribosome maturation factor RimP [Betaproteobacteria bacterium]|jgi:ribosome maturation factor RimP